MCERERMKREGGGGREGGREGGSHNLGYVVLQFCCVFLSEGCLELQHIDLSHCSLTVEGIKALGNCSHLSSLVLEYCLEVWQSPAVYE